MTYKQVLASFGMLLILTLTIAAPANAENTPQHQGQANNPGDPPSESRRQRLLETPPPILRICQQTRTFGPFFNVR